MIIGIYGYKKSGKTTLIEELIKNLSEYKIATIKHIHGDISIDKEGSDTFRHKLAGAKCVVGISDNCSTFIFSGKSDLDDILKKLEKINDFDLIILEGFKNAKNIKKIAVGDIEEMENTIYRYDNNLDKIIDFVRKFIEIEKIYKKLPGLGCGKCGESCNAMANLIYQGKKNFSDCQKLSKGNVIIEVNDKQIQVGQFVEEIVKSTIFGMVKSLKGVEEVTEVKINVSKGES